MSEKLWDGRFNQPMDRAVEAFTSSIDIDRRLYSWDIEGSIAHCRMLAKTGVIKKKEADDMVVGLTQIRDEIQSGAFTFTDELEDIHMHIEARLHTLIGKTALKLHTGRSRNDQIALDMRMFLREAASRIIDQMAHIRAVLVDLADIHTDVVMPGYTHTQRAQPILFSHHLMAYYDMFSRDQDRLSDCYRRINVMPLGAAALAGTTYPIDAAYVAEQLGFPRVVTNSMDAVSDRDFAIEFISVAAICMTHLSRLSEELILWSTSEFGFIELADAFTTGSSIMPQKKNPDVSELVRGKTGGVIGDLTAMLVLMKGLPLAYNRDMQEDKAPLFHSVDTLSACLEICERLLPTIKVNKKRMRQASTEGFLNATDLADYLVSKGMAFRKAHSLAGQAVARALDKGKELHHLTLEELKEHAAVIEPDVFSFLEVESMVNRRLSQGGTALKNVRQAIALAKESLMDRNKK